MKIFFFFFFGKINKIDKLLGRLGSPALRVASLPSEPPGTPQGKKETIQINRIRNEKGKLAT